MPIKIIASALVPMFILAFTACGPNNSALSSSDPSSGGNSSSIGSSSSTAASSSSAASSLKDIQSFSIHSPSIVGQITGTTITVDVPFGTDPTKLSADIVVNGGTVTVSGVTQDLNGGTSNDYSTNLVFRVTAEDLSTQDYTVTVRYKINTATYAGTGASGNLDGASGVARFSTLRWVVSDGTYLYVADGNYTIRRVTRSSGAVTTIAGSNSTVNNNSAIGTNASFRTIDGLAIDSTGANLYVVCDNIGHSIVRKIVLSGNYAVSTLAALPSGSVASGTAVDGSGNVYTSDTGFGNIYKVTSGGSVSVLAGNSNNSRTFMQDGTGSNAIFRYSRCLVYDGSANLYVGDDKLRKVVVSSGVVTTVSSNYLLSSGTPYSIALDPNKNLVYVGDKYGYKIRMCSLATGKVVDMAGTGSSGSANATPGLGSDASFSQFDGLGWDPMDNYLYVADTGNYVVRRVY